MARGSHAEFDATLVRLWNDIEPARLAGDTAALRRIERKATRIARDGDEAQQREAERLLDELRELDADQGRAPATARLDADVPTIERTFREVTPQPAERRGLEAEPEPIGPGEEDEERPRGLRRLMPLVWIAVFVVVLVLNLLGRE